MASTSNEERLAGILARCLSDLFSELGVHAEHLPGVGPSTSQGESMAAFSGFASSDLRGSFALIGPRAVFSRLHPLPPNVSPRDMADWACELVNQAIGRYRNQLLGYGVSLALGVPQSALGEQVRLSSSLRPGRKPIAFSIEGMILEGWLEVNLRPGFELPETPSEEKAAAFREGSLVFF
jgi:hypothetical protein